MIKLASLHYWRQLGLMADPFPAAVPVTLYYTNRCQQYLDFVLNTEQYRKALLLVVGESGVGKTTLLNRAYPSLQNKYKILKIDGRATLQAEGLLTFLANAFNALPSESQPTIEIAAEAFLDRLHKTGEHYCLVIDNAHLLPRETQALCLYLIKQQVLTYSCLQIILIGTVQLQTQFEKILESEVSGLSDYLLQILSIQPFSYEEVTEYLQSQLKLAGDTGQITFFSPVELAQIYRESKGLPLLIQATARLCLQNLVKPKKMFLSRFLRKPKLRFRFLFLLFVLIIVFFVSQKDFRPLLKALELQSISETPPVKEPVSVNGNVSDEGQDHDYTPGSHIIVNGEVHTIEAPQNLVIQEATLPVRAEIPVGKKIITKMNTEELVPRRSLAPNLNANSLAEREKMIINGEIQELPKLLGQSAAVRET